MLIDTPIVVSIGAFLTFYVVFAPLEYIPTIPPLFSYVIFVDMGGVVLSSGLQV